ncbi:MAG: sigma-54 dependent transcriptional regulator [Proteobacteria bacterium]|nr:sigma-54 dependent transcriptional regulator [Pseudomonadota bacterium]MBU1717236.1 sigma-54 dependent transcriptional regulator [Pseudomonadota bacterium]
MKPSILIIEDEKTVRISLKDALTSEGYSVHGVETGAEGIAALHNCSFTVIITDVRLPDVGGMTILQEASSSCQDTPVIVMTAYGSIEDAVTAMRRGAYDYITKPFNLDELLLLVQRAVELREIKDENSRLRKEIHKRFQFPDVIGESPAMQEIFRLIDKVSPTDTSILLQGESGTGKELIASTIHYQSLRKDRPIIRVNCASLPESLIESELFGYEKGAFTGATARKPGRFELADTGTIFLDEIGDLPLAVQTKLLRVLQEQTFERLGGTKTIKVDVRVITATNKELNKEVKNGNFRQDLFYRLNVVPITLPPLRQRREDIPLLIKALTTKFNDQLGTRVTFSDEAIQDLVKYDFPGNVRELQNIIERMLILAEDGTIKRNDLPKHIRKLKSETTPLATLAEVAAEAENSHIRKILQVTGGNKSKAAEILGVSRKTLWEKISSRNIDL